jgi:two-component system chemotaxis response regulator CheY
MKKRILVVDDSATVRQQISRALEDAGYAVLEAGDGAEGLRKAEATSDLRMVLCDVNMPVLDGLGMLAALHQKGLESRFPVVMLTSEVQLSLMARAKRLGAKAWIVKPCSPDALVATVSKLLATEQPGAPTR